MWPSDPNFVQAEQFVRSVNVVNGAVEGGVKLISDFPTIISTDAQQRSQLMQGVEYHRKFYPAFAKSDLNANKLNTLSLVCTAEHQDKEGKNG